ncbi:MULTISPECIES: magnesium chelatase domain-containing protein, partial [unclassified Variovorax]|uniref:magnesium chelatase domain-containing protein n=1 Tax=unclassified Variovorax TaxID=663243 RepID=UPI003F455FAE
MGLSLVQSRALLGLEAASVTVEVHLANGLPSFTLVGLVETEVKEARERVRSALQNAGLEFPNNKRIRCSQAPFGQNEQGNAGRHEDLCQEGSPAPAISVDALSQH